MLRTVMGQGGCGGAAAAHAKDRFLCSACGCACGGNGCFFPVDATQAPCRTRRMQRYVAPLRIYLRCNPLPLRTFLLLRKQTKKSASRSGTLSIDLEGSSPSVFLHPCRSRRGFSSLGRPGVAALIHSVNCHYPLAVDRSCRCQNRAVFGLGSRSQPPPDI